MVELNGKCNFINQNGDISSPDEWFDDSRPFKDGFASVELNGELYYIDKNGNITEEKPQVSESYIRDIIRESVMNYIKMDMIQ